MTKSLCFKVGRFLILFGAIFTLGAMPLIIKAHELSFYISPDGNDVWSGSVEQPFATLERARDQIRNLKKQGKMPSDGVTIEVAQGVYQLSQTFELTEEDSGSVIPIIYQAQANAEVRLLGGKVLGDFSRVRNRDILRRLDKKAQGKIWQTNLAAQGITEYGEPSGGFGKPSGAFVQLFFNDKPMKLARWPNEGFVNIVDTAGNEPFEIRGNKGNKVGKFVYQGDRPQRWIAEKDVWLHGYWFWDWADQRLKVDIIDTENRVISLASPHHYYGYRQGQWYYAFNVLAELDEPGEWYVDREKGILYFWPPAPLEEGKVMLSALPTLVNMKNASNVVLRGFIFEGARKTAIVINGGRDNRIVECTIRNIGGWAVQISGGKEHGVEGCDIYHIGDGGISLSGGDRKTLTPAQHYAENNYIHTFGKWNRVYRPAISLGGVGQYAAHNFIHNAPHQAIFFTGNDHLIEFNEIHDVCNESNDVGAIYAGRDWTMRGTMIRHNYIHDINGYQGKGCVGVYLDDMFSGTSVYGNIFYNVARATFIGGGRDNIIENNIFIKSPIPIHIDARGMRATKMINTTMKNTLQAMPFLSELWRSRYPELADIWRDQPEIPKGNVVVRNVIVGESWKGIQESASPYILLENNLLVDGVLSLKDSDILDFQLLENSLTYPLGFKPIPVEKIGLFESEIRASWPVE